MIAQTSKTTEQIVTDVLADTYNSFAYVENTKLISEIVDVLNDPAKSVMLHNGFESPAVYQVRSLLLNTYHAGVASVTATVAIFSALNRAEELAWLAQR